MKQPVVFGGKRPVFPVKTTGFSGQNDRFFRSKRPVFPVKTTGLSGPNDRSFQSKRPVFPVQTTRLSEHIDLFEIKERCSLFLYKRKVY